MRRSTLLAAPALAAALVGAAAPSANAATRECRIGVYSPGLEDSAPRVADLRARNLPRRTDGYAPPCLVAESLAGTVQFQASEGRRPARVRVFGARWNGGAWRCTYAGTAATCRKTGKPRRRVTFTLGTS